MVHSSSSLLHAASLLAVASQCPTPIAGLVSEPPRIENVVPPDFYERPESREMRCGYMIEPRRIERCFTISCANEPVRVQPIQSFKDRRRPTCQGDKNLSPKRVAKWRAHKKQNRR